MRSALALLAALVALSGAVALSCTAPLAGAPCECLPGYECDRARDVCRPIADGGPAADGSTFQPTDAFPSPDAGDPFGDGGIDPFDAAVDAGFPPTDASAGSSDADLGSSDRR